MTGVPHLRARFIVCIMSTALLAPIPLGARQADSALAASGRIVPLSKGALALVDGYFILVFEDGLRSLAGSGTYTARGAALRFTPERWFTARGGKPTYSKSPVNATLDAPSLRIAGEAPMLRAGTP
jgi:hypothetical protein